MSASVLVGARAPHQRFAEWLIHRPSYVKKISGVVCDSALIAVALAMAWYFRTDQLPVHNQTMVMVLTIQWLCSIPIFYLCGMYRALFRYASGTEQSVVMLVVILAGVPFAGIVTLYGLAGVPRMIGVASPLLLMLLVLGSRRVAHHLLNMAHGDPRCPAVITLIYGAGSTGAQLLAGLRHNPMFDVVGFMDDDQRLVGRSILGCRVYHPDELNHLRDKRHVMRVLLAMPKVRRRRRAEIVSHVREHGLTVQTVPALDDLAHGRVGVTELQEIDVVDLLGREPVEPSLPLLKQAVDGKTLLVTGAGGSIGSELCRQLLRADPRELVLVEHSEFALYSVIEELKRIAPASLPVHPILASVSDELRMEDVLRRFRPDIIYHAAAYKHVPLVESNVCAALYNNVIGTAVMARAARRAGVARFVLVSTDKAVRPTSIMGASKRLAELVLQAMADEGGPTLYSMVRFGNVLGSSGSVVPLFREQIRAGGPVTITHAEITRFFMTISEAAQLVLQAGAMAKGGDVFLLDMGDPVKIRDLASAMIRLSGLRVRDAEDPDGDIEIVTTGLRPGEKLYEELLIDAQARPTDHPQIFRATEDYQPWSALSGELKHLGKEIARNDTEAAIARLRRLVVGFRVNGPALDSAPPAAGGARPARDSGAKWFARVRHA